MEKELFKMTQEELDKYQTIEKLIAKEITAGDAAKLIGCSCRHVRRLKRKVRQKGAQGIIHGLRGKESNNKTDPEVWAKTKGIIQGKYPDFGPTLAYEKLTEVEGIKISKQTTRNLMIFENIWKPRSRKQNKKYRCQRERKECFGEMEQFDGCYHLWFESRGQETCLLAAIDDASGQITKAEFTASESVINVFKFWESYVAELGRPLAIYLDKFATYKVNHKNAVDNCEMITQFGRACKELDINLICANSPEAKGRVERLFLTLQDRLVKELRLHNISDIKNANKFLKDEFLPDFNKRFSVAAKKGNDLHRKLSDCQFANLEAVFSVQSLRVVQNDFTIRFKNQWIQITKDQEVTVLRKDRVLIQERLEGVLALRLRQKYLNFKILADKPRKVKEMMAVIPAKGKGHTPTPNHPWRGKYAGQPVEI